MRIELTDNNIKCENNIYSRNDIASLFPIADKTFLFRFYSNKKTADIKSAVFLFF